MEKKITYRHNIMGINSLETFLNVKGGLHQSVRDVYFVRAVGECADYAGKIYAMDARMLAEMKTGKLYYIRIKKLPPLRDREDISFYSGLYEEWERTGAFAFRHIRGTEELQCALSGALGDTLNIYKTEKSSASESMLRNFATKLLYWLEALFQEPLKAWKESGCMKVLAEHILKEQEYLFFYFLTLVGCDVLLLEHKKDVEVSERLKQLSLMFSLGSFGDTELGDYREAVLDVSEWEAATSRDLAGNRQNSADVQNLPEQRQSRSALGHLSGSRQNGSASQNPQGSRLNASASHNLPEQEQNPAMQWGHTGNRQNRPVPAAASRQDRREKTFEELAQLAASIVMIAVHDAKGQVLGTGSGIMISRDGYILSNNHVAAGGSFFSIRLENDETIYQTDEVIKYNPNLDLVILRIDRQLQPLPIYSLDKKLVRGQKVVAIGSPLGMFNSVSDGIIAGFRRIRDIDMIQFTAPTSPGSSGGAVLNMQGEVIGISTAGMDNGQNLNLAVGYESIRMFAGGFCDGLSCQLVNDSNIW